MTERSPLRVPHSPLVWFDEVHITVPRIDWGALNATVFEGQPVGYYQADTSHRPTRGHHQRSREMSEQSPFQAGQRVRLVHERISEGFRGTFARATHGVLTRRDVDGEWQMRIEEGMSDGAGEYWPPPAVLSPPGARDEYPPVSREQDRIPPELQPFVLDEDVPATQFRVGQRVRLVHERLYDPRATHLRGATVGVLSRLDRDGDWYMTVGDGPRVGAEALLMASALRERYHEYHGSVQRARVPDELQPFVLDEDQPAVPVAPAVGMRVRIVHERVHASTRDTWHSGVTHAILAARDVDGEWRARPEGEPGTASRLLVPSAAVREEYPPNYHENVRGGERYPTHVQPFVPEPVADTPVIKSPLSTVFAAGLRVRVRSLEGILAGTLAVGDIVTLVKQDVYGRWLVRTSSGAGRRLSHSPTTCGAIQSAMPVRPAWCYWVPDEMQPFELVTEDGQAVTHQPFEVRALQPVGARTRVTEGTWAGSTAIVERVDTSDGTSFVKFDDGHSTWVSSAYLAPAGEAAPRPPAIEDHLLAFEVPAQESIKYVHVNWGHLTAEQRRDVEERAKHEGGMHMPGGDVFLFFYAIPPSCVEIARRLMTNVIFSRNAPLLGLPVVSPLSA